MYCMKCGSKIDDQAKFCTYCGTPTPRGISVAKSKAAGSKAEGGSKKAEETPAPAEAATASASAVNTEVVATPKSAPAEVVTVSAPASEPAPTSALETAAESPSPAVTSEAEGNYTFATAMDRQKRRSRMSLRSALLIVLVMLALSGIAYAAHSAYRYYVEQVNPPIATVEEFTRALDEKDAEGAIACMDESARTMYSTTFELVDGAMQGLGLDVPDGASRAAFAQLMRELLPGLSSLAGEDIDYHLSVVASEQSIDGNRATITGTWHFTGISGDEAVEDDVPFTFNLVLEGTDWRIVYDETFKSN